MKFNEIKIRPPNKVRIVDITDKDYFSKSYSQYISNSKLSLLNPEEGGGPDKFKSGLGDNKIYSNALEFGSAVHQLVLQPGEFYLVDAVDKPTGKLSFMVDYLLENELSLNEKNITKAACAIGYFKGMLNAEKIEEVREKIRPFYNYIVDDVKEISYIKEPVYLSSYDRYRCQACLDSVKKHPAMQRLLYPSDAGTFNEATLLAEIEVLVPDEEVVTLKFKGKLDNYTVNHDKVILNDLKTTGKAIPDFVKSFQKYHQQTRNSIQIHFNEI
ncbi:MAG: hypothetical protein EZS28_043143 [Streblomastix strix]|uniref:Uncharacterized protein n=1 Tax=Streblomastix strix TaxID=222440 RepID=A0A5J4TUU3_9EUKA|nr:MAG: hypothetical protein EZS28_043143 [Streblomastix strix]